MRKVITALVIAGALAGCVSKKKYDDLVVAQTQITEKKDSVMAEVLAATQMVTEINADLAKVKGLGVTPVNSGDRPLTGSAEERAVLLGKVREVLTRLDAAEKQVADQRKKVAGLTGERTKMLAQLDGFQKMIDDLKTAATSQESVITAQKAQIVTLTSRVDTLTMQSATLASEKDAERAAKIATIDTLTRVVDEQNTVYYAVGTKDELVKRGILINEGSKFLVFGGKTLQPARELKPELFQKLDRRRDTVLTVPEPGKEYRIVTRQSPSYLASNVMQNGRVKGDLHVTSPAFWDAGKFLILVRD